MKLTSYCISCELKLQKLFGKGNFFKCMFCDKLTNALDKLEIASQKAKYNINIFNINCNFSRDNLLIALILTFNKLSPKFSLSIFF